MGINWDFSKIAKNLVLLSLFISTFLVLGFFTTRSLSDRRNEPGDIKLGQKGTIYIADSYKDAILELTESNSEISYFKVIGGLGRGNKGQVLDKPVDLALAKDGSLYIADLGYSTILVNKQNSWEYLRVDDLKTPRGIYLDENNNLYITDTVNNQVLVFSLGQNKLLNKWGSQGQLDGQFNSPEGLVVSQQGHVYVIDKGNYRIQKFDTNGHFITKWGSYGTGDSQFNSITGIAVDSQENIYITDSLNNNIQKISPDGTFLKKWESSYGNSGYPQGIAVNQSGEIYVLVMGNHRVAKFSPDGVLLNRFGADYEVPSIFLIWFIISIIIFIVISLIEFRQTRRISRRTIIGLGGLSAEIILWLIIGWELGRSIVIS